MHQTTQYLDKTIELLKILPDFCERFYMTKQTEITSLTQYNYASRMKLFLQYLQTNVPRFANTSLSDFSLTDMASITEDEAITFSESILEAGKSDSTAYAYCESISAYYTFFFKSRFKLPDGSYFFENPFEGIKPKKSKRQIQSVYENKTQCITINSMVIH